MTKKHMRTCTVPGCAEKHLAKNLCRKHYLRNWKHGDPNIIKVQRGIAAVERVRLRLRIDPTGCWIYTGCLTSRGYGHIRFGKTMKMVHRVMFEHQKGPVPDGMDVDHICRNRACCNPDHLEAVSHKENVRRGVAGSTWRDRQRNRDGRFS